MRAERLRELLDYDPDTGKFRWRKRRGVAEGRECRCASNGYIVIRVDRRLYRAHRLAWLYVRGEWPRDVLDHIDGDKTNNRIDNLRACSQSENLANRGKTSRNTTGFKGVMRVGGRFVAQIQFAGLNRYIGSFDTPKEAHKAYLTKAAQLHGDFANGG